MKSGRLLAEYPGRGVEWPMDFLRRPAPLILPDGSEHHLARFVKGESGQFDVLAGPTGAQQTVVTWATDDDGNVVDIVGASGRRAGTVVSVRALGAIGDGRDETSLVRAAHAYANAVGLPVSYAGLAQIGVQADAQIPLQTSTDFAHCELVLLGGVVGDANWINALHVAYIVSDPACPVTTVTGAVDAGDLVVGSLFPTRGLFSGHGYARVECALQIPNRDRNGTTNYRQAFKVHRNGQASLPLSADLSAHAAAITVRYRKSSRKHLSIRNLSIVEGAWNQQKVLRIDRCNVSVDETTFLYPDGATTFDNVCAILDLNDVCDVTIDGFVTTGRPVSGADGSYCLQITGGADIYVRRMHAITGWGATGTNDVNGLYFDDCVINRIDAHFGGHNIFVDRCTLHEYAVRYGWGGGVLSVRNCRAIRAQSVIRYRGDYAGSWYGSMVVEGVETNAHNTNALYVIDLATAALGAGAHGMVEAPHTIRVAGITRTGVSSSSNGILYPLLLKVRQAGDSVRAPANIEFDGLTSNARPSGWRWAALIDLLNMEAALGNGGTIIRVKDIRAWTAATSTTGLLDYDSIITPSTPVSLRLFVDDCDNFHARVRLANGPIITVNNSGVNGLQTVTSGTRPRVALKGCWMTAAASGYTNPPIGAGRSGAGSFTSLIDCEFGGATAFDCSEVSLAQGCVVRAGGAVPLIPGAATAETLFTGFREAGAFE